jgi:transposase InsO family protein
LLVTGFPNAEFKSFRLLADAEAYLFPGGAPDIAFLSLHQDGVPDASSYPVSQQQASSDHLPVLPVGGGHIGNASSAKKKDLLLPKAFTLNAYAPEWQPNRVSRPLTQIKRSSTFSNTNSELKTSKNSNNQSDPIFQFPHSLAFPAIDTVSPRNGGFLFFADGNDHEAYDERLLVADDKDNHAFPFLDTKSPAKILQQLRDKKRQIQDLERSGQQGHWMYFDSGASRTVIRQDSPLRSHLTDVIPAKGSCTIGNGDKLSYVETGTITTNNVATVVQGLEFDLYSAVDAAKRGVSAVIDFDPDTGENRSFTYCKHTREISPLVERRHGSLEVPVHLFLSRQNTVGLMAKDAPLTSRHPGTNDLSVHTAVSPFVKPAPTPQNGKNKSKPLVPRAMNPIPVPDVKTQYRPFQISAFWNSFNSNNLSLVCRDHNQTELSLFTYDVVHSLNQRDRDFLIHARLAHLPSNKIVQLIKNGNNGLPFSGKLMDLCRPCMESRQRAHNRGKHADRNPNGQIGEHLHSDLAIVNVNDYFGFRYVLTVVDEVSDEVVAVLLKDKTADTVLAACKRAHAIITSRSNSKLKTWQFDRGSEFLNRAFDEWIHEQLGAKQLFSNVEHPWENGRAERSFQTLFSKARSMMKYADLPTGTWGRAILHAVYLKNRSPSSRLHGLSPLQFRTGQPVDFTKLRLFGSPAQIFIRPTARNSNKLSNRSEHGTFLGMSSRGNGYIFRVDRHNAIVEVDSRDAMFNETFRDIRDRKGRLVRGGVVLPPDLHVTPESESNFDEPSQDGIIAPPTSSRPVQLSNKFGLLTDPEDTNTPDAENTSTNTTEIPSNDSNTATSTTPASTPLPTNKHWKYVPDLGPTGKGDRKNDGPKSISFFQVPATTLSPNRRSSRNVPQSSTEVPATKVLSAFMPSPDGYNPELDTLLSCLESKVPPDLCLLSSKRTTALHEAFPADLDGRDPKSQKEIDALSPTEAKRYNDATITEFLGMKKKRVMDLIPLSQLPKGIKIYPSVVNWTTKKVLGIYSKTKCRICFGGHRYDKAYTDCFAPTVNFTSVLMILCLGTMLGWFFGSIDYSQAYLNANIDELCVMRAPEFLREYNANGEEQYWRLKKVIYGHPKGSRLWADCLHRKLVQLGFTQFKTDQCAYARWKNWNLDSISSESTITIILVHSDDLIIASNNQENLKRIKTQLLQAFDGVDQGELTSFCGVEIKATPDSMELSMDYYWNKLLKKFHVDEHDTQDTPLKSKILRSECPQHVDKARQKEYLQIMGSIIYGYTHCRLDLAYAVGMLTRVMHSPSANHLSQLRNLLKYINKTKDWRMTYHRDPSVTYGMDFVFHGGVDSSHADDLDTMRSTGGWFFFLQPGQGCVSAKSGQSPDVALSSTESETIWACSAATQGAYIKQFVDELCIFRKVTFELHEDSQPAINAQKRNVSQSKFRHIKTKYYYIRQLLYDGWAKMVKIDTTNQVADMATKILSSVTTLRFTKIVLGHHT